uniref:Uncharacterized protein n=1 Tax=Acrobeloides nanus TaxID=290746 RepID=A0A914DJS3_9BILA
MASEMVAPNARAAAQSWAAFLQMASITELDDQLEDWAETLPEHLQEEFDIFWNQIWDIIDELREYASKVNVSDKAKPYVEKIIEILSNDNIKQDDMKPIAMKVMGSAPKAVLKEILSFIIEILDHVKPMIPKLVIPEMAHYFKNEDFLGLKKKLQNFE